MVNKGSNIAQFISLRILILSAGSPFWVGILHFLTYRC